MDWIHKQTKQEWSQCALKPTDHKWKEAFWPNGRKYDYHDVDKQHQVCPLCRWKGGPEQVEVYTWLISNGFDKLVLCYHPEDMPKEKGKRLTFFANVLLDAATNLWVLIDFDVKGVWISYHGHEDKLKKQQSKTVIKTYYAITRSLPIIRIKQGSPNTLELLKQALIKVKNGSKFEIVNFYTTGVYGNNDYDWLMHRTPKGLKPIAHHIGAYKRWAEEHTTKSFLYNEVMNNNIKGLKKWDEFKQPREPVKVKHGLDSFECHQDSDNNVETESPW